MMGDTHTSAKLDAVQTIDLAIQRTRYLLFEPFLYSRWLNLGVMIFLAVLAGGVRLTNYASYLFYFQGVDVEDAYFDAEAYVLDNLGTILMMAVPIFAVIATISAALMYVGARGTMMVIRAVAADDDDIGENWRSVASPAWTYFVFRLELAIAMGVYLFIAGFVGVVLGRQQLTSGAPEPGLIAGIAVVVTITTLVSIAYAFAMFSMRNFIAPLVYHLNVPITGAWGRYFEIVRRNPGQFLLYVLLKVVYAMVFGVARTFAGYCTCCLGFLPVISQSILAPAHVFERAYSLYVLGSLGPDYAIIHEPKPPEPPMLPPAIDAPPPPDINR